MRIALTATTAALLVGLATPAMATGPSGSTENRRTRQVRCADGTVTPVGVVYASPSGASGKKSNGIDVCSQDDALPIDGRIIVNTDEGYASLDGDPSNSETVSVPARPEAANGFTRVDSTGVHCDEDHRYWDSTTQGGECRPG